MRNVVPPPTWLKHIRDAVVCLNEEGRILWANPGAELLLGRSEEDLCCLALKDLIADNTIAERVIKDLEQAKGKEFVCVLDLSDAEGNPLPLELTLLPVEGDSSRILVAHVDPEEANETDLMALQALQLSNRLTGLQAQVHELSAELLDKTIQLAEEKSKTEAVLVSMREGLVVVDREGRIVQVNDAASRILDITPENAIGRLITDFAQGSKLSSIAKMIQIGEGAAGPEGTVPTRIEMQEKVVELTFAPIREREHGGQEGGTVVNLRDVTKQAEVDRMKSELISIVSHELRSPLANITGYLDLILSDPNCSLSEDLTNFLEIARKNSRKLAKLVDEMLDLSRLDAGKVEMNLADVDVEYLVNFAHLSFRNEAESKGIEFSKKVTGNPHVMGDLDRLQQVLNNLTGNALKYTQPGGRVEISAKAEGESVKVIVSDTGIGIRPEDQSRLFQRFFRVRSSETRKIRGTGLGLSIAKSIVDAHNGRLTVTSEYGKGSRFEVDLPAWRT